MIRRSCSAQPIGQRGGGDRRDRRGITQHELIRADGTAGSIGTYAAPVFEHRQHRHDRLSRPRQQQRHPLSRTHPVAGQLVRQPVRRLVELPVRRRDALEGHRHRVRRTRTACAAKGGRDRHRRAHRPGSTPPGYPTRPTGRSSASPSTSTDDSRRLRVGGHRHQHPLATARPGFRCRPRRTRRCRIRREGPARCPAWAWTASG